MASRPAAAPIPLAAAAEERMSLGRMGLRVLLVSLGVLFAAGIVGHLAIRLRAAQWPPAGWPGLPAGLWLSSALIVLSGVTLQVALSAVRGGRQRRLRRGLAAATVLGLAFLASQVWNWRVMVAAGAVPKQSLFAFTSYVLTALHGLHVVGGLIPLAVVTARAHAGRYSPHHHDGVELVTTYWHFLAVIWFLVFGVLAV